MAAIRAIEARKRVRFICVEVGVEGTGDGLQEHIALVSVECIEAGAEDYLPYDRPPLSKELLRGEWGEERLALRRRDYAELELDLRLGRRATALDAKARQIALDDGTQVGWDGLLIATGAAPRPLRGVKGLEGVHLLRTLDDALALRADLEATPGRVVVVGAGFIGAEVAASCRWRGLEVTLEAAPAEARCNRVRRRAGQRVGSDTFPVRNQGDRGRTALCPQDCRDLGGACERDVGGHDEHGRAIFGREDPGRLRHGRVQVRARLPDHAGAALSRQVRGARIAADESNAIEHRHTRQRVENVREHGERKPATRGEVERIR